MSEIKPSNIDEFFDALLTNQPCLPYWKTSGLDFCSWQESLFWKILPVLDLVDFDVCEDEARDSVSESKPSSVDDFFVVHLVTPTMISNRTQLFLISFVPGIPALPNFSRNGPCRFFHKSIPAMQTCR